MCDKVILVPRKLPWDVWFLWKASPDGGWGSSGLWHSSARAKRCSCDSRREAWQTLRRNRGSCHQDKMRIAVGGPSLAFCFCPGSGGCPGNSGAASRSIWNFKRAPAGDLPPAFSEGSFPWRGRAPWTTLKAGSVQHLWQGPVGWLASLADGSERGSVDHHLALAPHTDGSDLLLPHLRIFLKWHPSFSWQKYHSWQTDHCSSNYDDSFNGEDNHIKWFLFRSVWWISDCHGMCSTARSKEEG